MSDQETPRSSGDDIVTLVETICGPSLEPGATIRIDYPGTTRNDAAEQSAPGTRILSPQELGVQLQTLKLTTISSGSNEGNAAVLRDCSREYFLGSMIGRGGQGDVLEASQVILGREVAIKRAKGDFQAQLDFFKESFTSAQLDHPNIVPVYDMGLVDGDDGKVPILAMKRVRGTPWHKMLEEDRNSLELGREAFLVKHLSIFTLVINAICYAHSKGIIHRDLKPQQVMVGDYGEAYLLDWGLAVVLDDATSIPDDDSTRARYFTLNSASNPAGTPAYMAPEQARLGTELLGVHTDIYLLGAILYELLTGKPPHMAENGRAAIAKAVRNKFDPIPTSAPQELAAMALRCMATNPKDRPEKALRIREAIEAYLSGAGQKAESRAITREIEESASERSYEAISQQAQKLAQAEHLWPDNPALEPLRERILEAFVHEALARGDFLLAQIQADRLHNEEKAEGLRACIDKAREEAAAAIPFPRLLTLPRMLVLVALNLFIVAAFVYLNVAGQRAIMSEVSDKVMSIAGLAAGDIDVRDLRAVDRDRDINTPEFQRVLQRLNLYRRSNEDIRHIYAVRPEPGAGEKTWRWLVDADPVDVDLDGSGTIETGEEGAPPGMLYEDGSDEMWEAYSEGKPTSGVLFDSWGNFISGFAPVLDPVTGQPDAIVGVDIPLEAVEQRVGRLRILNIVGALTLMLLITAALIAFFSSRRALQRVGQLESVIQKQNTEVRRKDLYLG